MSYHLQGLDQLAAMRAGIDYTFEISLRQFKMRCRPLTIAETASITSQVRSEMMKLPPDERTALQENLMLAKAYLERSSTSGPGVYDPQITHAILGEMTADEIQHLYKQYVLVEARANPMLEQLPKEELQSLVELLKKTPQEALVSELTGLSILHLVSLCRELISRG
jgi:hypothetical protein